MAPRKKGAKVTYTYTFQDGVSLVIEAGKDGVTKELIAFLNLSDHDMALQDRYQAENEDYGYQNILKWYFSVTSRNGGKQIDHPMYWFPDPKADIMRILFPEEKSVPQMIRKIEQAIEMLTESQRDLIWESYGLLKGDTEIAKSLNVSREAIQNRRKRILKQIQKLMNA